MARASGGGVSNNMHPLRWEKIPPLNKGGQNVV